MGTLYHLTALHVLLRLLYAQSIDEDFGNACTSPNIPCNRPAQSHNSFTDNNLTGQKLPRSIEEACTEVFGTDLTHMCTDDWGRLQIVLQNAKKTVDKIFNHTQGNGNSVNTLWKTFFASDKIAKDMSYPALILLQATKQLTELGMTLTEIREAYSPKTVEEVSKKSLCQSTPIEECAAGGFRTFSGYCNNVAHPMWGTVFQAFSRIAPASYLDGISIPRKAADGFDLPSSLLVSETVFTDSAGGKHPAASLLLAQWAQFVYDDLVKIGTLTDKNGALVNCCNIEQSSECFPVRSTVPAKSTCIPYSRTLPALNASCTLGERQQANQATAFLDASMIYGNTGKTAAILRSYKNGELKVLRAAKGHFLLPQEENIQNCASAASQLCFLSGTSNVNLMPTQTALHTVWVLQHNRVAKRLKEINEFWDDERIYRETRKIIGAQIQHITFNEFLPVVLGSNAMQNEKITLEPNGYSGDYDMEENPSVLNEYATAAGLFFYSLFPESMLLPKSGRSVKFAGSFYDSQILYTHNGLEDIIRFMLNENSKHFGTSVGSQFTDGFLSTSGIPGFDLMAVFIQMGRDHGLPSYVEIRKHCGLKPVKSFGDLETAVQNKEVIQKLKLLYKRVDDIDLLPMGLAEKPLPGSFVGPTFACIIAKQFAKVQRGDRYWYESFFYPSQFTSTQLSEIRKTSLATVLCDNVPDMTYIQPAAFMTPDNYENAVISCKSELMKPMNISAWRDVEPPIELPITERTIENAIRIAEQRVRDVQLKERHLQLSKVMFFGNDVGRQQLEINHRVMSPSQEALDIARTADILLEATKVLINDEQLGQKNTPGLKLDITTLQKMLPRIEIRSFIANATGNNQRCNRKLFPCDPTSPYRTITGWCNNLRNPENGMAFSPFRRLLKPLYSDGFSEPRKFSIDGSLLPNARKVANVMHPSKDVIHKKYSHFLMMFGQFLDHDMTHTPMTVAPDGSPLECSACNSSETVSSNCWPIPIPHDDPHFPPTMPDGSPRCMHFVRSLIGQLTLGYREQLNQLTSYIDASNVYGSNDCIASDLRLFSQGKLNYSRTIFGLQQALPFGFRDPDCKSHADKCFLAGDIRVNENSGLMVPHILFVSEHNRIAEKLYHLNSFWSDERIYQETRKIVGAMMQHITFKEWLPKVIGNKLMDVYGLQLKSNGYYDGYDQFCDATIANEFAAAAFRFGHTLVRDNFHLIHPHYHSFVDEMRLKHMFFNITPLQQYNNAGMQFMATGLLRTPAMAFDRYINQDLRNHLFEFKGKPFSGMDLPALNIQRARDHGIPGYNAYREYCGLRKAIYFTDLSDTMDDDAISAFISLYRHVDDIDLFPGLISERPLAGSLVGPTLGCIIGEQMKKLRNCDRFWYENNIAENRFTPGQLAEIRKVTLASIICNNMKKVKRIQPRAFDMPDDFMNAEVDCAGLQQLDITKWLDRKFCLVKHRVINMGKTKSISPCVSCTCTHYGTYCQAKRIENCDSLMNRYLISEVQDDTACVIQCSGAIQKRLSHQTKNDKPAELDEAFHL